MKWTVILIAVIFVFGQNLWASECKPPEIVFNSNTGNIFTPAQEMILGEAVFEQLKNQFPIVNDKELSGPLSRIAEKLVRHLPETGIRFNFYVVDIPDTNAFITAGGNVFITRKLIAFVKDEDELAGILAHELGHGVVRHSAIDISKGFRDVLKVDSVGDRKDIFEKFNRYIDNRRRKKSNSAGHEGDQQMEADKIGLYAMAAAGYNPERFSSAFDRLTETEGETGGWFSDFVGNTRPEQKRLREIVKAIEKLPAECLDAQTSVSRSSFENWQTTVLRFQPKELDSKHPLMIRKVALTPTYRDNISQLSFSPDGKFVLARDVSSIFVIRKDPYETLFRIDVDRVKIAQFSADSTKVLILTSDLRFERWDIGSKNAEHIADIYIRGGCSELEMSPSGIFLACYRFTGAISFYNLNTKELFFEKEDFFKLGNREYYLTGYLGNTTFRNMEMEFSPSGRYFIAAKLASTIRFRIAGGHPSTSQNRDSYFGYDFVENKELRIPGSLKDIISLPFAFVSDNELIGQNRKNEENSGIFEFPSGERKEKFELKANSLDAPPGGEYLLVRPIKVAPVGVFDLKKKSFVVANQRSALAVYGDKFVSENKDGVLGLFDLNEDKTIGELDLPDSRLGSLRSVSVSPDLNWIAVSGSQRGSVWSLYSGKRVSYTLGFSGALFDSDGRVYLDFVKTKETQRQTGILDLKTSRLGEGQMISKPIGTQYGELFVSRKFDSKVKVKEVDRFADIFGVPIVESISDSRIAGTLEVQNIRNMVTLWSREFSKSMPEVGVDGLTNTMTFMWPLRDDEVKEIIKDDPAMKKIASDKRESENDFYIQVVDGNTGAVKGGMAVETGRGSFGIEQVLSAGDWVVVADTQNRIQFYSLKSGELIYRFFGNNFTISGENNLAAIGNGTGEMAVYDLATGRLLERFEIGKTITFARFGKYGKKLVVLTNDQQAILFDISSLQKPNDVSDSN